MNRRRIDWPKALVWAGMVLACIAFWVALLWAVAPAKAAPTPGQELADETAEFIGETMKVPPLYRELLSSGGPIMLDGAQMAGVVWCQTPRATTIDSSWLAAWEDLAARRLPSDRNLVAAVVIFHELAHRAPETCIFDRYLEEGITQAITLDLMPAWCQTFLGFPCRFGNELYPEEVTYIRHQSARATGAGWKTRAARLWRRAFYLSDRDTRRAMIPPTRGGSA